MEYIAQISHGKDSLKMLDVIATRGLPLDRITTTDVWATDSIRGEYPEMVAFKERADEYIWKKYRIEVEHLRATLRGEKVTYENLFYHVTKSKGERESKVQGFPAQRKPWCKKLKVEYVKLPILPGKNRKNVVKYLGIAADEPKRFGQLNDRIRAPLVEFGIEEGVCGLHCQYEGIPAPSYEAGCRDGCWMCHNQGADKLRRLRKNHPELWELLLKWDADSPGAFKASGHTVKDYDKRFYLEDKRFLIPGNKAFKWKMLEEPLQRRIY